jgi:hypothetical protein
MTKTYLITLVDVLQIPLSNLEAMLFKCLRLRFNNCEDLDCGLVYTGSFIKNEPISKLYFAVRKQRCGKSRMPLQRA